MSKKLIPVIFFAAISLTIYSQRSSMELTFTAVDIAAYVQLDSIKIMNRTQGGDTMLYYPDTVLSIYYLGVPDFSGEHTDFQVFQNYPNPMTDKTTISLFVPEKDRVYLVVTDMLGRVILKTERELEKGIQSFVFIPGSENLYCFTARWRGNLSSIKILCSSSYSAGKGILEYSGYEPSSPKLKLSDTVQDFNFSPGDELLYIGYAGGIECGLLDIPEENRTYIIQFATNIPCPGTPTVEYEGQVYNTIQIFGQCWLKENLNVGTMIPGTMQPSNNGTIEKYCYDDDINNCSIYGGLYLWDEMMQYTNQQGVQGICPPGWHLPADEEWKVLEGSVDSQYGIGDPEWDLQWCRGIDAGTNLKTTTGWYENGNGNDLYGFSALPGGLLLNYKFAGMRDDLLFDRGFFDLKGYQGDWFSSTECYGMMTWWHSLYDGTCVERDFYYKDWGLSVRCLRDE